MSIAGNIILLGLSVQLGRRLLHCILIALRSGMANAAGTHYHRARRPDYFWFTVAAHVFFAGLCGLAAACLLLRLLGVL